MGQGEYGGNGSVHWKLVHGNGSSIVCTGNSNARGVDKDPATGGDFKVTVEDVGPTSYNYNASSRTLTVTVPIKHGATYTRQVRVQWPQGGSPVTSASRVTSTRSSGRKATKTRKTTKTAKARKKR
jgi:hypothetical protein